MGPPHKGKKNELENKVTVLSYSEMGANAYEDPMNLGFLYGQVTVDFLKNIRFSMRNETVLDIGCGTGFGFDVLRNRLDSLNLNCIGIEPAEGMLEIARKKYDGEGRYSFHPGSFEDIPLPDRSVDRIISTLALHWVKKLDIAAAEMRRVLKDKGRLDILMIAKDDGANFKKSIVEVQKKHLTFAQIMKTALLVQRVTKDECAEIFRKHFMGFDVNVTEHRKVVFGTFDEHMKWWKARSTPVIAEVKDKNGFFEDLREQMTLVSADGRIPFDSAFLFISAVGN